MTDRTRPPHERSRQGLSRRDLLAGALALPLVTALRRSRRADMRLPGLAEIKKAPFHVATSETGVSGTSMTVVRVWQGTRCVSRITNPTKRAVRIDEVVLFDLELGLPESTALYGEGFQMLTQNGGTLGHPADLGSYTDAKHYKLPMPAGAHTYYGLMTLSPSAGDGLTPLKSGSSEGWPAPPKPRSSEGWGLAFTSCRRFSGLFRFRGPSSLQIVVDTDGLALGPGETWELEEFSCAPGPDRNTLLGDVATRIAVHHPPQKTASPPTGWCSWYCFGARVTAQQVLDNLDAIAKKIPGLTYVQLDDGYQPAMGDWLETGTAFGGDVRSVLDAIRRRGFQPAIWVAPFIAEEKSHVFEQHPGWFVKDTDDSPLRSDKVTFGGWRKGPWYVLDGTHPEVQAHFEHVFSTMRKEWGVTYFKLDANFWGAIHGGRFHDPNATRIEAYRRGMKAIGRGAGDGFLLGCNHPIWPSIGLIHGSRSSNDIKRTWDRIKTTAQQNLLRGWQNGRLWWNDPDAICLSGELPENEFLFHATAIYATGGMLLSGDDLTTLPDARLAMLKKLLPPTGIAAQFDDDDLRVGTVELPGTNKKMFCCFNWADAPVTLTKRLDTPVRVTDVWTGATLGRMENRLTLEEMPPRSARLLEAIDA